MSYAAGLPTLYSKSKKLGHILVNVSAFDRYSDAGDWSDRVEAELTKCAATVVRDMERHIKQGLTGNVMDLCVLALHKSLSCFVMFNSWMSSSYRDFLGHGLSEKKAWSLATRLGASFFRALDETRGVVRNEFRMDDCEHTAASYFYATAKTHDKMAEFTSVNFKDHPSMANEMVSFLFMSEDSSDLGSFDTKLASLKDDVTKKCKDAKDVASAAASAADQAKKSSQTAGNKIEEI